MPEPKEGLELKPRGKSTFWIDGHAFELRRPDVDEFSKLYESAERIADVIDGRQSGKSFSTVAKESIEWMREAFNMLCDEPLPEVGLPLWLLSTDGTQKLIMHWINSDAVIEG